jgi:hypothetical protein
MKLMNKVDLLMIKTKLKLDSFFHDEKGDTNFISILVILGIVLALAGIFLGFKDQVLGWVDTNIGDFFSKSGGR